MPALPCVAIVALHMLYVWLCLSVLLHALYALCRSEQRATDVSVEKCRKRYAIFKQHYTATLRLKQFFPFHLIDAMGTLAETQEAITKELRCEGGADAW